MKPIKTNEKFVSKIASFNVRAVSVTRDPTVSHNKGDLVTIVDIDRNSRMIKDTHRTVLADSMRRRYFKK